MSAAAIADNGDGAPDGLLAEPIVDAGSAVGADALRACTDFLFPSCAWLGAAMTTPSAHSADTNVTPIAFLKTERACEDRKTAFKETPSLAKG
ncbi:hypothetical protein WM40_05655 [Robbsia andropogonis]|uniref:Uncharacterized protein n=1 Tax=Robbsia andropogonis TaxID=28092 RepID=A0A0F5K2Q3_9BURK|nr:hypothetical protein WM40_05655 [Robbsia andropogonis]